MYLADDTRSDLTKRDANDFVIAAYCPHRVAMKFVHPEHALSCHKHLCVAVCCIVLQCVALCRIVLQMRFVHPERALACHQHGCCSVAVCCSVSVALLHTSLLQPRNKSVAQMTASSLTRMSQKTLLQHRDVQTKIPIPHLKTSMHTGSTLDGVF